MIELADNIFKLSQQVGEYSPGHMRTELEDLAHSAAAEITRLTASLEVAEEALIVANQALLEMNHAYVNGSDWYTRGESGLRTQVRMWIDRGLKAITEALAKIKEIRENKE